MTTKIATVLRQVKKTDVLDSRQVRLDVWQSAKGIWKHQRKNPLRYQQSVRTERRLGA